ncbi:hypothetical protein DE146DRAFT_14039 [Phaeosphaeria sp. MPI-PUGE-AT-0046c]|nr:hypothetical protein DE146DRAFT_14039 [Phaeosphaeria sp. MPI-PUGE-AT-0046c]
MAFNQVEFQALSTDYYKSCSRVFWDKSVVAEAPKEGSWPSITQIETCNLHKNDAAVLLFRQMPFGEFEQDKAYGKHVIMLNTRVQNYCSIEKQDLIRNGDLEYYVEDILPEGRSLLPSCI